MYHCGEIEGRGTYLKENGIASTIYKVSDKMSDDGSFYCDIAKNRGVQVCDFTSDTDLQGYEIIVDCILGTGFKGEVRGLAKDAISKFQDSNVDAIITDEIEMFEEVQAEHNDRTDFEVMSERIGRMLD